MAGARSRVEAVGGGITLLLIALALMLRVLIPAGFMPATGQGVAIMLCTGMGATTVWVDANGDIHKQKPPADGQKDQPCAFAGFGAAFDLPGFAGNPIAPAFSTAALAPAISVVVAIGQGLAAPPPPSTGPPSAP